MTSKEAGYILLTSHLGDIKRPVLTSNMLRTLYYGVYETRKNNPGKEFPTDELLYRSVDRDLAERTQKLMSQQQELYDYVKAGYDQDIIPLTPLTPEYPQLLLKRRGLDAPGCIWCRGDISYFQRPAISCVGSRNLSFNGTTFAQSVGEQAARQGYVLVSGNAIGSDWVSEISAVEKGGNVISVVCNRMELMPADPAVLYVSEFDYDMRFSTQRAHSRNRTIHALGLITLVSECTAGSGGTWQGSTENLKNGWSPLACEDSKCPGNIALHNLGAQLVTLWDLQDLDGLCQRLSQSF